MRSILDKVGTRWVRQELEERERIMTYFTHDFIPIYMHVSFPGFYYFFILHFKQRWG